MKCGLVITKIAENTSYPLRIVLNIIQISDLHRSAIAPVSNEFLLETLLSDIEKHPTQSPKIPPCDVVVVTGDLVSGARMDDTNPDDTLKKQYAQAKDFLIRLSKELLDGDLRRLFIVPGNHDVSWRASRKSMEKVEVLRQSEVWGMLAAPNSQYRWSWNDLSLYHIRSREEYAKRLGNFKEFFDDFYKNIGITFSLEDRGQTLNFVTPDSLALFTGFCSLYENDCFKVRGQISIDDLSANDLTLRESAVNEIALKVAFWHHGIEETGYHDDHLNTAEVLPHLIDRGYVLGLHGHHHKSDVISYAYSLNPQLVMPIVGCGSLCAGPYDIPPGYRRQYNVIEVNDKLARVRVHVREWFQDTIWVAARVQEFGGNSYVDLPLPILQAIIQKSGRKTSTMINQAIQRAEIAVRNKDYDNALKILINAPRNIPLVRKLLIESLQMLGRWQELIDVIESPTNPDELALMIEALLRLKQFSKAQNTLDRCSSEPETYDMVLIRELTKRLAAERRAAI